MKECSWIRVRVRCWLDYYTFIFTCTHAQNLIQARQRVEHNTQYKPHCKSSSIKDHLARKRVAGNEIPTNKPRAGTSGHLFSNGIFHSFHSVWWATAYLPPSVMIAFCCLDCIIVQCHDDNVDLSHTIFHFSLSLHNVILVG